MWVCRTMASDPVRLIGSAPAPGKEVRRPVELTVLKCEIARGDGRREPVVEPLGDPQPGVQAVPAQSQGQGMPAQLAGVEQTQQLHLAEHRPAQRFELQGAVLTDVPRVAGLLARSEE